MFYNFESLQCSDSNEFNIDFDTLRFISPDGDLFFSKEKHMHAELITEDNLSKIPGPSGILDIYRRGYVVLCPIPSSSTLFISHIIEPTKRQREIAKFIASKFSCKTIYLPEEDISLD